ncbi:MAG TPA: carboxypeptidase-like regulatory domain-containing protein [Thermoanaerobaculia bacterium]|jgi:hypothetical protein|nr:carboxypeptidase-like regulatory domain-containing protein [Thermoanaerobaculia bacterium]
MKEALQLSILLLATAQGAQAVGSDKAADPQPVSVCFDVALQAPSKAPFRGEVKLARQVSADFKGNEELSVVVETGHKTCVAPSASSVWEAQIVAPGFWVRRFTLAVGSSGEQIQQLEAWPLGHVVGRLVSSEKPPALPKKLIVTTLPARSSAKNRKSPKGEIECPIDSEGRFRCDVPAATYDLSIFAETFIPHYSWDVSVVGGGETDLKTFTLRRGASLAGWVETAEGDVVDPERCRVVLSPTVTSGAGDLGALEKLSLMGREARVNERGFFQVVGLAPGSYTVGVEQEDALAEPRGPIQVAAGGETYLPEPFLLEAPLDLELVVEPAKDWLGRPWAIHVERALGRGDFRTETMFDGKTSKEGVARVKKQKRGRFTVWVSDSTGQKMLTEHDLEIIHPVDARHTFQIRWVEIKGEVRLGKAPLRAALWFGGQHGVTSIRFDSDEEGKFSGVLPREGHWPIELTAEKPRISLELHRTVEARKGRAEIEIEVPSTRLFGRVVDTEGHPAAQATVSVLEGDGANQWLVTEAEGRFEFRGVAPGNLTVGAQSRRGDLISADQALALPEDGEVGPIELALRPTARFSGVVRSSRGAEGGAAVTFIGSRPARYGNDRTLTAVDGGFEAKLPAAIESAVAVVGVLGSALTAFELRPGEKADLFVPDAGGAVEIELGSLRQRFLEQEAWLMLFQNGMELPANSLADWARSHGEPAFGLTPSRFSELAPGEYSACVVPLSARLALSQTGWSPKLAVECRSGSLAPGQKLRLAFSTSDEK